MNKRDIRSITPVADVNFILRESLLLLNVMEYYIYIYIVITPDDVVAETDAC
jgi:hypothetical protein